MLDYVRWIFRLDFCTPRYIILKVRLGLEKLKISEKLERLVLSGKLEKKRKRT